MSSSDRNGEPRSVLARGISVLQAFGPRDVSLTLAVLARRTGLPKPTVHRLARELISLGALERSDGGYRLGMLLFELGHRTARTTGLRDVAMPFLLRLLETTHQVINLAILDGSDVVYVDRLRAKSSPRLQSTVGGRMPAHCTALGKALLAHAPTAHVDEVVGGGLPAHGPNTITTGAALRAELAVVADRRVAYDIQESSAASFCVAAPVLDYRGDAVAALSVTGLEDKESLQRVAHVVDDVATRLSRLYTLRVLAEMAPNA